jgi:hypothetical protein
MVEAVGWLSVVRSLELIPSSWNQPFFFGVPHFDGEPESTSPENACYRAAFPTVNRNPLHLKMLSLPGAGAVAGPSRVKPWLA